MREIRTSGSMRGVWKQDRSSRFGGHCATSLLYRGLTRRSARGGTIRWRYCALRFGDTVDIASPLAADPAFRDVLAHPLRIASTRVAVAAAAAAAGDDRLAGLQHDATAGRHRVERAVAAAFE